MRKGRRELAHAADANDARNRVLLHTQLLLGALLLVHQKADRKARHRQHDHQRLKRRDIDRIARRKMDGGDQPDLGDRQAEHHAFEAEADRAPDHRNEEEIEQRKMHQLDVAHREPQRRDDQRERTEHLPSDDADASVREQNQDKRRHHHDADHVADPIAQRRCRELLRIEKAERSNDAHVSKRDERRRNGCDSHEPEQVALVAK